MGIAREDLAPKAYDVLTRDVSLEELNTKVTGPASSTTNAIAKFSGTDGKEIQNSGITIDASNNINGANTLTLATVTVAPLTVSSTSLVTNLNADLLDSKHASDFSLTSHNHALNGLSNVTITSISSGEILKWNGSAWINNTLSEAGISETGHIHALSDLTDTNIVTPDNGDALIWNSTSSKWEVGNVSSGTIDSLDDITDVTITDISSDEILKWNGTAWINNTLAEAGISATGHTHSYAPNAFSTIAVSGQSNVVADSTADTLTLVAGTNVTLTTNATNDSVTITSSHPDITAASSVNNSGRTYIQDITLDADGHVTGLASATEADQNTFNNIHALNSSGTDVTNSPFTATTSTSSLNLKAGTGITLAMDTSGIITITGSTTYTHPTFTTRSINIDTSGVDVLDTLTFTSDANGHVTAASGATRTLPSATTSVTGVLTSTDWNTFNGKMDATASTTAGYVPVWGANGKTLGTGYSVETTMTGSSSALVRADAVKTYIDGIIATADALVYKGVIDCSTNPNYPAGDKGHVYKVSVAGKIGGASGVTVEAGDMLICNTDSTASGTQATVGSKWDIIQNNIDLSTLQPKDANLTAIAALSGTGFAVRTANNTWANRSITNGTGILITNGDGISGNVTVAHTDTSTQATVTNTGRTYIQSITLDGMGHITGLSSATETVTNTNTTYSVKASSQTGGAGLDLDAGGSGSGTDTVKFIGGTNVTVAYTDANTITINSTHPDITPASSVNNSGRTYIQDITLDADGHVTGLASATETVTDTNYYPTAYAWSNGTTAGPTGSLTGTGMSAVYFGAIPSASGTVSGIVTTGAQTIAGVKTFTSNIVGDLTGNVTGNVSGSSGSCTGNAATATKLSNINTTFTGTYPLTVNVNGVIYSHTGITYSGSGNTLTAGTFSGNLTGDVTGNVSGSSGSCTGNAATATKLATARTISLTGDVTGSASFDGSANASITATVADDSHNHTIANVDSLQTTLDGKVPTGRTVTAGNGMTGGGALSANITLTLGTPGSCSTSTSNAVTTTSHTHAITGVATSDHTHTAFDEPITIGGDTLIGNAGSARKRLSWGGFYGASATNTGTIKIDLGTDNIMFNARISIRSYLFTATILVGGYTYTGSTTWHSTQATGQIHGGPLNVRFTSSGSNRYIHIGETNTAWSGYLQVTIDEVNNGYGGALFTTPFTITLETAYTGTIDSTIAIPMYSGTADAPTSTSRVNVNGYLYATRVYNAVFNDYAECFNSDYHIEDIKYRIVEIKNGKAHPATEESESVIGVVSTTYGFLLHGSEEEIKNSVKVPVGMAGTLMVDAENIVEEKDINRFVCSGIEGKARVIQKGEAYKYEGCIVGKVIGIDTATNQYKLLIMLK